MPIGGAAQVELLLKAENALGESPTWSASENALYWVDVTAPALYRLHLPSLKIQQWKLPADIGGFALTPSLDGALVALRHGLFGLDFQTCLLTKLAAAPFDSGMFRFNEGGCDPSGRFWIGVMFDPAKATATSRMGRLHSFTFSGGLRREPDFAELHNGMAWTEDGSTMFVTHGEDSAIFQYSVDDDQRISDPRVFAIVTDGGAPDGAALDSDGGYWCAVYGAGKLRRYRSDGSVDRDVALPISQPTMCAFGGERLDTLFISTARQGLTFDQLAREPLAGSILYFKPGERGIYQRCTVA